MQAEVAFIPRYLLFAGYPPTEENPDNDVKSRGFHAILGASNELQALLDGAGKLEPEVWWQIVDVTKCSIELHSEMEKTVH